MCLVKWAKSTLALGCLPFRFFQKTFTFYVKKIPLGISSWSILWEYEHSRSLNYNRWQKFWYLCLLLFYSMLIANLVAHSWLDWLTGLAQHWEKWRVRSMLLISFENMMELAAVNLFPWKCVRGHTVTLLVMWRK